MALHEPYDISLANEQVACFGFMAATHVQILEVFPFHEQLPGDAPASGAYGHANAEFTAPGEGAGEQQVADVGAAD